MADASQVFNTPILASRLPFGTIGNGNTVTVTFYLVVMPANLEYVRVFVPGGTPPEGPIDVVISQTIGSTAEEDIVYEALAAQTPVFDNLVKPVPLGRYNAAVNAAGDITMTVVPPSGTPGVDVIVTNNSGGDLVIEAELGYRPMNRGIDLKPTAASGVGTASTNSASL